jgi:hypothetical protein
MLKKGDKGMPSSTTRTKARRRSHPVRRRHPKKISSTRYGRRKSRFGMNLKAGMVAAAVALAVLPRMTQAESVSSNADGTLTPLMKPTNAIQAPTIDSVSAAARRVAQMASTPTGAAAMLTLDAGSDGFAREGRDILINGVSAGIAAATVGTRPGFFQFVKINSPHISRIGKEFAVAGASAVAGNVPGAAGGVAVASLDTLMLFAEYQVYTLEIEIEKFTHVATKGLATRMDEVRRLSAMETSQSTLNMIHEILTDTEISVEFMLFGQNLPRPVQSSRENHTIAQIREKFTNLKPKFVLAVKQIMKPSSAFDPADMHDRYIVFMEHYNAISFFLEKFGSADLYTNFAQQMVSFEDFGGIVTQANIAEIIDMVASDSQWAARETHRKVREVSRKAGDTFMDVFSVQQDVVDECKAVYGQFTAAKVGTSIISGGVNSAARLALAGATTAVPWAISAVADSLATSLHLHLPEPTPIDPSLLSGPEILARNPGVYGEMTKATLSGAGDAAAGSAYKMWMMANVMSNQQSCTSGAAKYNKWIRYASAQIEGGMEASFVPLVSYVSDVAVQGAATTNAATGEGTVLAQTQEVADATLTAVQENIITPAYNSAVQGALNVEEGLYNIAEGAKNAFLAGADYVGVKKEVEYVGDAISTGAERVGSAISEGAERVGINKGVRYAKNAVSAGVEGAKNAVSAGAEYARNKFKGWLGGSSTAFGARRQSAHFARISDDEMLTLMFGIQNKKKKRTTTTTTRRRKSSHRRKSKSKGTKTVKSRR